MNRKTMDKLHKNFMKKISECKEKISQEILDSYYVFVGHPEELEATIMYRIKRVCLANSMRPPSDIFILPTGQQQANLVMIFKIDKQYILKATWALNVDKVSQIVWASIYFNTQQYDSNNIRICSKKSGLKFSIFFREIRKCRKMRLLRIKQ